MAGGHGATNPGKVRKQNEDAMLSAPDLGLFVVADGMGGHNAGEVASQLALEAIRAFVARSSQDPDHTWPFGIDVRLTYSANRLRTAVKLANRRVFKHSESREQYTGMGTTVAAVLLDPPHAVLCSVGDSRIYAIGGGTIARLTRDHTWIETLIAQSPGLDPATLANHPMKHVLTTVVGAQDDLEVDVATRPIAPGERLLLCTDGVHGALEDPEIRDIVESAPDSQTAADRLVAAALERDGRDNLTAVVVDAPAASQITDQ